MVHGLPASTLQRYILNTSELWFIFMGLYIGSVLALWEAFPDVTGQRQELGVIAIVFNCLVALDLFAAVAAITIFGKSKGE